jgi:hypothetical protein
MTNQEAIAAVKRNPISFGCGALALVLAVTQYLRLEEIPGADAELALRTADRDRVSLNIKYSAQLTEQEAAMNAALKVIEGRLIRPGELGINTQYFYELETATGVKILDLRQANPTSAPANPGGAVAARAAKVTYVPVGFTVGLQGTLPQLLEFLRQLENGAHYCRVLTASFSGSPAARKTALSLSLSLEVLGQQ